MTMHNRPNAQDLGPGELLTGWVWKGTGRWAKDFGGGVTGVVYAVAAGLFTGGLEALFGDHLTIGANYGFRDGGHPAACDAVDAMHEKYQDRVFRPLRYTESVACWLTEAGYTVTTTRNSGPGHVISVDLGGRAADLLWDTRSWRIVVHPGKPATGGGGLPKQLTGQPRMLPRDVLALARPMLDEAIAGKLA